MVNKNEKNIRTTDKDMGNIDDVVETSTEPMAKNQEFSQRQEFKIDLPNGSNLDSTHLSDEAYRSAMWCKTLQEQIQALAPQVNDYHAKQEHFRLEMKEFLYLVDYKDGETN